MSKEFAIIFLLCSILLSSCGGIKTYTDYDERADFNDYSRYSYYDDMKTGLNTLDQQRFTKAIDSTLQDKTFRKSDPADFRINFYSQMYQKTSRNNIGIGIGAIGGHVGGNVSSGIPIESKTDRMVLTIEIIDESKNQLVWQGEADAKFKANLSPEERQAYFYKIAQKTLKPFPPDS